MDFPVFPFWNSFSSGIYAFVQQNFDLIEVNIVSTNLKLEMFNAALILLFNDINKMEKALGLTNLTFKSNFAKQSSRQEKYFLGFLRSAWICGYNMVMSFPRRGKMHD